MDDFYSNLIELKSKVDKVYIYGAGLFGTNIYRELLRHGANIDGFVVTSKGKQESLLGVSVKDASEICNENAGIIIGVNRRNEVNVRAHLSHLGFDMRKVINGNDIMDDDGTRGGTMIHPL